MGFHRIHWNPQPVTTFLFAALALALALVTSIPSIAAQAQAVLDDGQLLIQLKTNLSDPANRLSSWSLDTSGNSSSHCQWIGIVCKNGTDRVAEISLKQMGLEGRISSVIGQLTALEFIDLSWNKISGFIPENITDCTQLTDINLSENLLTGSIPSSIGLLTRLVNLRLHRNNLQGGIPSSIGRLTRLERLRLEDNLLDGSLPSDIGNCSSLIFLHVFNNALRGRIPPQLGRLKKLTHLSLHQNSFSSTLPIELSGCVSLKRLSIYGNDFGGSSIPGDLSQLRNLDHLQASSCNLSGSFPAELGSIPGLIELDVSDNRLFGDLPPVLGGSWKQLQSLNLSRNRLTGPVPDPFGSLPQLVALDLSNNNLSGVLPVGFGLLAGLSTLSLSRNSFTGALPPALGMNSSLLHLNASNNNFTGVLPQGLCAKNNLTLLDVSNNEMEGTLASLENCSSLDTLVISENRFSSLPQLGQLSKLKLLRLASNQFTGSTVPEAIGGLPLLEALDLSRNGFQGDLPDITSLTLLHTLDLSHNSLTGELPQALTTFTALEMLDVSSNMFTGPIPALTESSQLKDFNFSSNNFSGSIPQIRLFTSAPIDAFMNNLELCGPPLAKSCDVEQTPPPPSATNSGRRSRSERRRRSAGRVVGLVFIVLAGVLLAASAIFLVCSYKALKRSSRQAQGGAIQENKFADRVPLLYAEIEKATEGFSDANVIGTGPHGAVYKGIFAWEKILAVKVVRGEQETAEDQKNSYYFTAAARKLTRIRHPNIVKLEEFLIYRGAKIFLYEYMPNRSLGEALRRPSGPKLHWNTRYKIALGAAQGLSYLHHQHSIVHCDVKSNNLLLDSAFGARIADVGLAKLIKSSRNLASLNRSLGYAAPEAARVSQKADVYSYGIVLLELLTGRSPVMEDGNGIAAWVRSSIADDQPLSDIVDPILRNVNGSFQEELSSVFKVALICTDHSPNRRPSMKEVVEVLSRIRKEPGGPKLRSLRSFIHRRSFVLLNTQDHEL